MENNIEATAIKQDIETLEARSCELFKDKVLPQLQKSISEVSWDEESKKWCSINIPFKNGNYILSINYDWQMAIWFGDSNENSNSKEINAIRKKMSEAAGAMDDEWGKVYVWASSNVPYLGYPGIDKKLFFYRLNEQYSEHTSEVVNTIVNFVNELNNVP